MGRPQVADPTRNLTDSEVRVIQALDSQIRMAEDPDAPLPIALTSMTKGTSVNKLFEDGGNLRLLWARALMERSFKYRGRKWTVEEGSQLCVNFFADAEMCQMIPTIGGLALYLGTTQKDLDAYIRAGHACSEVFTHAKEAIRLWIEQAAMDGKINPLIYFHQQGAYSGYNPKTEIELSAPIRLDPDPQQIDQIIKALPDAQTEV